MKKISKVMLTLSVVLAICFLLSEIYFMFGGKLGKPVIYLYPTKEQKVDVKLNFDGNITCTYPQYNHGWSVIASPNGNLFNISDKKNYSYLFWEGEKTIKWDLSKGFVVKGSDTREFLQSKLSEIGLVEKEYNEFIVYWLPKMQENRYNLISFTNEQYEKNVKLEISPKPDSVLRVFMVYKELLMPRKVEEQKFIPFKRNGFTVVEWGGEELE